MKKIVTLATIALLLLTPWMNAEANKSRSTNAYGGECLIWTLPLLVYGISDGIREEL